jgi:hypothetical protein
LDTETRCRVLVAIFLQGWAAMELALRDAIGAALNVETVRLQILCANIHFRDKTHILRTLVDVSSFSEVEKRTAKNKLRKLTNHAAKRNMIAHDPFMADGEIDGVRFITVKAKGEYDTPKVVWLRQRFAQEDYALKGYTKFLECLEQRFKTKPLTQQLTQQNYTHVLRPFLYMDMGSKTDL